MSDDPEQRLLDAIDRHGSRAFRGLRGAALFAERLPRRAAGVLDRGERRADQANDREKASSRTLDPFRSVRYRSGPWEGEGHEFMPVSWFLLWRSNVDWVPDPAILKRASDGRFRAAPPSHRDKTTVHPRPLPKQFILKPEQFRLRPSDAVAARNRPSLEE